MSNKNKLFKEILSERLRINDKVWEKVIKYIDKKKINEIVTRKELTSLSNNNYIKNTTIDYYRIVLDRIGILSYESLGKYKKIRNIPEGLTTSEARKFSCMKPDWKRWFIPLDEFLKSERNKK
jgi:hypothetical protein